jgi:hypothetical protein
MEYNSASKQKEMLSHTTTWMNLEDIILCERSQSQKDRYCMILFTWDIKKSQNLGNRKCNHGGQGLV